MPETGFVETYRGGVPAWECDVFGHLNIAFYVGRFAAAAADLLERHGAAAADTVTLDTRYLAELRAGEGLVIHSALLAASGTTARIAHELVTAGGTQASRAEHVVALAAPAPLAPAAVAWEAFAPLDLPATDGAIPSGRSRVRDGETARGSLSAEGHVHRFSDACLFVLEALGMTEPYRRTANRGFATFETRLALERPGPAAGEGVALASGIVEIGGSSLRMVHRMRATGDGRMLARYYQAGVHFDLAARRSAPWPAEFRARAESLRLASA